MSEVEKDLFKALPAAGQSRRVSPIAVLGFIDLFPQIGRINASLSAK